MRSSKCILALSAVFFYLCVYVQLNDPDAVIWVCFYLSPATLCTLLLFNPSCAGNVQYYVDAQDFGWFTTVTNVLRLICVLFSFFLILTLLKKRDEPYTTVFDLEEGRELGGTLIVFLWTSTLKWRQHGWLSVAVVVVPLMMWSSCHFSFTAERLSYCKAMHDTCRLN